MVVEGTQTWMTCPAHQEDQALNLSPALMSHGDMAKLDSALRVRIFHLGYLCSPLIYFEYAMSWDDLYALQRWSGFQHRQTILRHFATGGGSQIPQR